MVQLLAASLLAHHSHQGCNAGSCAATADAGSCAARHTSPEQHPTVSIMECNAREALAALEHVAHERLLRLEAAFSHLIGCEGVCVEHLTSCRQSLGEMRQAARPLLKLESAFSHLVVVERVWIVQLLATRCTVYVAKKNR